MNHETLPAGSAARTADLPSGESDMQAFFLEIADACGQETLRYFRQRPDVTNKEDAGFDPVTEADKNAEAIIRQLITERFPGHGIIGEEHGDENTQAHYCWVIDPIDGTRAFISGLPSWGCLIGLKAGGLPVAGMMHQPFTGETYLALGNGSSLIHKGINGRIATSSTQKLSDSILMATAPELFAGERHARFSAVSKAVRLTRYGFDCYGYAMVAAGNIDLVVECGLKPFDIVPLIPIIEQAGGLVTTWDGGPAADGGDIVAAANPELHKQALALLA